MSTAPTFNFTTGVSPVPDGGLTLSYNGCRFSPMFATAVSGRVIKDEARRTTMYMEYTIIVDGYVCGPTNAAGVGGSIAPIMDTLRELLTAQGGHLVYEGRGFDLNVNPDSGETAFSQDFDVAWGPIPELIEFQPLGGSLSARVQWKVTVRVPEIKGASGIVTGGPLTPLLQFVYETIVTYNEDQYSTLSLRGALEIPLTRRPDQRTRTLQRTADDLRAQIGARLVGEIDLSRFRVTKRNFHLSKDRRVLTWDFVIEEKPPMDLPVGCALARGNFLVRPARAGMGLVSWLCTLRVTYTVRKDLPRRTAWIAFLLLLRWRMAMSSLAPEVTTTTDPNPPRPPKLPPTINILALGPVGLLLFWLRAQLAQQSTAINKIPKKERKALLCDFSIDEGLHLDSKTVTFCASWRLVCPFSHVLLASGLWTKMPEEDVNKKNLWATSMKDIQGVNSWLINRVDPTLDVVVDFGGG